MINGHRYLALTLGKGLAVLKCHQAGNLFPAPRQLAGNLVKQLTATFSGSCRQPGKGQMCITDRSFTDGRPTADIRANPSPVAGFLTMKVFSVTVRLPFK